MSLKNLPSLVVLAAALAGYLVMGSCRASTEQVKSADEQLPPAGPDRVYSSITAEFQKQTAELAPAHIAGELDAARVSAADRTADWPSIAASLDGTLWAIYIEWDGKGSDRVVVKQRVDGGDWSSPIVIHDGYWDHYIPDIVALPEGALAAWSAQVDGNFEIFVARISRKGKVDRVERVTSARYSDFHVRAAADSDGNVTLVWQSFRNGQADIYAQRLTESHWGPAVRISPSDANDWEPAVALDSGGRAWISWDSYHGGSYDVFLASFDGKEATDPVAITSSPSASFHTSVAVDQTDRVWIAFDEAGPNWGKDFSTSSSADGSEGLHARRSVGVRIYVHGRVYEPAAVSDAFTGRMERFAELPTIAIDGKGTPTLVFRHWTIAKPHEMYHFYATRLGSSGWSQPWLLENSSGRNTQRAAVAIANDGVVNAIYSSDLRAPDNLPKDQEHALHYNVFLAELTFSGPARDVILSHVPVLPVSEGFERRRRATMSLGDKHYTLLLGDCHRHTDIRGHSNVDGSTEDTYRYALDAAQLDFVGPSDHNEVVGGTWPDGLRDYQWWVTQKLVDVMTHEPNFWGIYTYEHSMARPGGHRNALFLRRGAPMRGIDRRRKAPATDNQPPAMWSWWRDNVLKQVGQKSVIVPHTFAAGPLADWNWPNAPFDCLLEIYQGARGSYERWRMPVSEKRGGTQTDDPGHFAQDALNKGNVYGFVSFSDHGSTHNSWAGIWVDELTREAMFDAMLARRTFGASDEIVVRATAGDHMPGERFSASMGAPPEIVISLEAPDEILRVDIVKNGEYVFTQRPGGRSASLRYRDMSPEPGDTYYYVRVFQRDPENPSGDPEIAWASPFFVQYE